MNAYAVKHYFEDINPKAKECFETGDGLLHATKKEAQEWVKRHSNKAIATHKNPAVKEDVKATGEQQ